MLQIVTPPIKLGGSGRGISYYSTAARCPRRAKLDGQNKGSSSGYDAKVGTIDHGILELFYDGKLDPAILRDPNLFLQVPEDFVDAKDEALRLAQAYFRKYPELDFWGTPIGVEIQLPTEGMKQAVNEFFLVDLTARLDLATRVNEAQLERIAERTGLRLPGPGVYIVDHKFRTRRDSYIGETYLLSAAFTAYPAMWNLHYPDDQCVGMIANVTVANKEVVFQQALVSPPDENALRGLQNWLIGANELAGTDFPNWTSCRDFNRTCGHFTSGACSRY